VRPWLIGEMNPYGADPKFALYPLPENASGGRLAKILGLNRTWYMRAWERRINLCVGKWSMKAARLAAKDVQRESLDSGATLVLLGAKVTQAFGFDFEPFTKLASPVGPREFVILPHPSGLSRLWNEPGAVQRARDLVLPLLHFQTRTIGGAP